MQDIITREELFELIKTHIKPEWHTSDAFGIAEKLVIIVKPIMTIFDDIDRLQNCDVKNDWYLINKGERSVHMLYDGKHHIYYDHHAVAHDSYIFEMIVSCLAWYHTGTILPIYWLEIGAIMIGERLNKEITKS